jgi:hypothetical protein
MPSDRLSIAWRAWLVAKTYQNHEINKVHTVKVNVQATCAQQYLATSQAKQFYNLLLTVIWPHWCEGVWQTHLGELPAVFAGNGMKTTIQPVRTGRCQMDESGSSQTKSTHMLSHVQGCSIHLCLSVCHHMVAISFVKNVCSCEIGQIVFSHCGSTFYHLSCICISVCIWVCVCRWNICICVCICTHLCTCKHLYTYMYMYMYMYMYICYVYSCTCIYQCICICICIYVYVYVYVHVYMLCIHM